MHVSICRHLYNQTECSVLIPLPSTDKGIDGALFCSLSREDLAVLFPRDDQFVTGVKLYKHIQECRRDQLNDSACSSVVGISHCNSSIVSDATSKRHPSTSCDSHHSSDSGPSSKSRKRSVDQSLVGFDFTEFSPDIKDAIKRDAFLTAAKRNKLIREACRSFKGHCRQGGMAITQEGKKELSKKLYSLAPKSLGDPPSVGVAGQPYVSYEMK